MEDACGNGMAMSPLALQACQACGTSLAGVPVTQTENAPWHWHRCYCRCIQLQMIACKYHLIHLSDANMPNQYAPLDPLVAANVPKCAQVMMGFIFGVERTLKLPLMISLRRPDRSGPIQTGWTVCWWYWYVKDSPRFYMASNSILRIYNDL